MNNEELFRQALQRQNDRAKGMKMPDDMEQKVMRRIKTKRATHRWLFPLSIAAVAACLALLMTFHYLYNKVEPKKERSCGGPEDGERAACCSAERTANESPAGSERQKRHDKDDCQTTENKNEKEGNPRYAGQRHLATQGERSQSHEDTG